MANLQMNKLSYDFFYGGSDMCKGVCTPPPPAEDPPKPPPAPPTPTPTFSTSSLSSSSPIISHLPSGSPITTTTVTTTTTTTTTYPPTLYAPSASYPPVYPPNYTYTQLQYNPLLKCRRRSKSADNYYEIGGKITGTCCGGGPNCTCACRFSFSNIFPSSNNMCNSNTCNNTCNNNNNNNVNNNNNNNNNNMMLDGFNRNDNALLLNLNNNNNAYTTTEYKRKPSTERLYSHEEAVPGRCHVLVAEDNEVNQKVLSLLLKRLQATVEVCANGQEALDKLLADPSKFDLVLMDVQMPIMDGYTAAMEIRKYPTLVHIPIIAMTANAMPGDRERCLNSGMDDYIAKPINMKVLTPILQLWGKKTYIIS